MKIIQLVTRRQRRGAEVFAADLSEQLLTRGHDIYFVGLYEPPSGDAKLTVPGAQNLDLNGALLPLNPLLVWQLKQLLDEIEPDLVQANGSDTLKYSALAKRLSRRQWPLVYRNISLASHWVRNPLQQKWIAWLFGAVDWVLSVSARSRQDFAVTYGFPLARMSAVPRALRLDKEYDRATARTYLAEAGSVEAREGPFLIHVGSFTEEKNHRWLLGVFGQVLTARPNVHLFLVGDGPLRPEVEAEVAKRELAGNVHLLGYRTDVNRLVAGADLFVLPSLVEGIPGVVLEAGAQRVPTVATDVGGVREAVEHEESGLIVPSGNAEAFGQAIERFLSQPEERKRVGENAYRRVHAHHDIQAIASRFEKVYDMLRREHTRA